MNTQLTVVKNRSPLLLPKLAGEVVAVLVWGVSSNAYAQTVPPQNAQFYQQYQETLVAPDPANPPAAIATTNPPPQVTVAPSSFSEPVWVIPESPTSPATPPATPLPPTAPSPVAPFPTPTAPALVPPESAPPAFGSPAFGSPTRVTVPALPTAPKPPMPGRSANPAQPKIPPDLALIATDVQIFGADAELQQFIFNTIKTKPGGQTSQNQLRQDVATLLETGLFVSATVDSRVNPNGLSVMFQVQPIVVRALRLAGAQVLTQAIAEDLFRFQLGAPVNPVGLNQAVQRINQWYAQNGYPLARVLTLEPSRDGVITLTVAEGLVGDIKVRFLGKDGKPVDAKGQPIRPRSQEAFIRRQIKLQPGQVFREEVVRGDLRRLSELGVFDGINVGFEGDARLVTVVYNVTEGKSRGFNFGGGFNDDLGLYGTVSFQDTNFAGLAQKVNASAQVGVRDVQFDGRFVSPYRETEPGIPGYSADVFRRQGLSRVFDDEIRLPNGSRVRERRYGVGFTLDRPLGPTWSGSVGLNYQNISIRDREGDIFATDARGNPLTLSGTGIDDLVTVAFSAIRDQRDNPANPGKGSYLSLSSEQSIPIGRGRILGNKLEANYAQYVPVSIIKGWQGDQPQVLAFNVQGGTVVGDLPPYNAFILGGVNSVRGYDFGEVSTSRSYVLASAEYRFPIFKFIGGVVFFDIGSGLNTQDDVPGEPGIERDRPGTGFGGGLGLRFNSPIGIIRTELGINNQGEARFHFGFGQRF